MAAKKTTLPAPAKKAVKKSSGSDAMPPWVTSARKGAAKKAAARKTGGK